jgi:methionyl-tRNA synthetase
MQSFIPGIASKIFHMLNLGKLDYSDLNTDNITTVQKFKPFIGRLEKNEFEEILD